jgi:flagellar motility protein MotE (MotC chaperone)
MSKKVSRRLPIRVLPMLLVALFLLLTVTISDVWDGFSSLSNNIQVSTATAQAQAQANIAAAQQQQAQNGQAKPAGEPQVATTSAAVPTAELPRDPTRFSQSEIDLLQALSQRRDKLEERERTLDQREALLKAAEKRLEEKVADLDAVKLELQQMLAKNNQEEDGRLRSLVRIYESMKPKEAALIFDKLEINVLLGVVERMKENKVAPILASMQPDRARQVTDMLADKSQRPPPRR